MQDADFRTEILAKGYTVIRKALSFEEVQSLRKTLLSYFKHGDFI